MKPCREDRSLSANAGEHGTSARERSGLLSEEPPRFAVFVLGAGFSRSAGLPLAPELWKEVRRRAELMTGRAGQVSDLSVTRQRVPPVVPFAIAPALNGALMRAGRQVLGELFFQSLLHHRLSLVIRNRRQSRCCPLRTYENARRKDFGREFWAALRGHPVLLTYQLEFYSFPPYLVSPFSYSIFLLVRTSSVRQELVLLGMQFEVA